MIGETGANNGLSPCSLCENWQAYLIEIFCHLTREIEPVAMWIEDDWRLHNHGEEMGFGGCFCNVCLERFAQKTGEATAKPCSRACWPEERRIHGARTGWSTQKNPCSSQRKNSQRP